MEHVCVLEPMCRACTIGGTIAFVLVALAVVLAIAAVADRLHLYFAKIEERISNLEKTNNVKKVSYGGKKNVRN